MKECNQTEKGTIKKNQRKCRAMLIKKNIWSYGSGWRGLYQELPTKKTELESINYETI